MSHPYAQPFEALNTRCRSLIVRAGRGMKLRAGLLGVGLLLCAPVVAFQGGQVETSMSKAGIWISPMEVMALPADGPAWDALLAQANKPISPNLSDQTDPSNVRVLARALVATRTGSAQAREEVLLALKQVQGTEVGARALAVSRELMAYVIAAELIGLKGKERDDFESWLRLVREQAFQGRSLNSVHEGRPNNWGTHAGASRLAVAIYLNDRDEIERAAWVFRGYTGDVNGWHDFKFGERWWQPDNVCRDFGITPSGARIGTHHIGGVLPDEMRRGGPFRWPPPKVNYVYEALQGAVAQAVILERLGMPAWEWGDRALLRAFEWLHEQADYPAEGDDTWMPHVVNRAYGTRFPAPIPARPGKATGFADWTHGRAVP
jgi:Alginate lyase